MSYVPSYLADTIDPMGGGIERSNSFDAINFVPLEPSFYQRTYKTMRDLRQGLEKVGRELGQTPRSYGREMNQRIDYLEFIVQSLLRSDYASIFQCADNAKDNILAIINDPKAHSIVRKHGFFVLHSMLSLSRLKTLIESHSNITYSPNIDSSNFISPGSPPQASHFSPPMDPDQTSVLVLCRICEEYVPLSLIEKHSKSCACAYQEHYSIISTDEKIMKLQKAIRQSSLACPWPGEESNATNLYIPILHASLILDRIMKFESSQYDNEMSVLFETLSNIYLHIEDKQNSEFLLRARDLADEKVTACKRYAQAAAVQRKTLAEPSFSDTKNKAEAQISDFLFVKRISSGAYARVFLGSKQRTGDIYAIKVIPKSSLQQKNQVQRVLAEKDILLKFYNPYIVSFYYSIIGEHNLYLVMEYLPGGDLYSVLQSLGSLPEESTRIYAAQIVSALKYLRENQIIHRDLKPDNILITSTGGLKLTDFGLSYYGFVDRGVKNVTSHESIIQSESLVGTPDYTSPEIVMARAHTFTADYWSLGVMLYEFVFGAPPFHSNDETEIFNNIRKAEIVFPSEVPCSNVFRDFISKLLVSDPEKRLGANSIDEIINHPWFRGIDWNNLADLPPPFVPDTTNPISTEYFQDRYHFGNTDEIDILADIKLAKAKESMISESENQEDCIDDKETAENKINKQFPAVALDQLERSNQIIAKKIRHRRIQCSDNAELSIGTSDELRKSISMNHQTDEASVSQQTCVRSSSAEDLWMK